MASARALVVVQSSSGVGWTWARKQFSSPDPSLQGKGEKSVFGAAGESIVLRAHTKSAPYRGHDSQRRAFIVAMLLSLAFLSRLCVSSRSFYNKQDSVH